MVACVSHWSAIASNSTLGLLAVLTFGGFAAARGNLRSLTGVRRIVRHHHELLNGKGYPDGLRGDDIPLLAQIIGIVDVYDALTTRRPYRAAWSEERAFEELTAHAKAGARQPDLVSIFIALARRGQLRIGGDGGRSNSIASQGVA